MLVPASTLMLMTSMLGVLAASLPAQLPIWVQATPTKSPAGRYLHAMAYDVQRKCTILFGGWPGGDETWSWDGQVWKQLSPPTFPSSRSEHTLVYDSARKRIVLFGGISNKTGTYLDDTWEWDGWTWIPRQTATAPSKRGRHAMAYDSVRKQVVLFGGEMNSTYYADTWLWDGKIWTPVLFPKTHPSARSRHMMTFDSKRQHVVLGGGMPATAGLTWLWDGSKWTSSSSTSPLGNRYESAMVFDSGRDRTVLFGGRGFADTWEWDGSAWKQVNAVKGPTARWGHAMAYDSLRRQTVLFSGRDYSNTIEDTWSFSDTGLATFGSVGSGCGSPAVLLAAAGSSRPIIGTTFTIKTNNAPARSTVGIMQLGFSDRWFGTLPLPLNLSFLGMHGCTLYQSMDLAWVYSLSNGSGTFSIPIPKDLKYVGNKVHIQALIIPAQVHLPGIVMSNGGELVIGSH